MKPERNRARLLLWVFPLLLIAGTVAVLRDDPGAATRRGFPAYLYYLLDTNGDRLLSRDEFGVDVALDAAFESIDVDADGIADVSEVRAYFRTRPMPEAFARLYVTPLGELEEVPGRLLSDNRSWNNAPAIAVSDAGIEWVAFVSHSQDAGDKVLIQRRDGEGATETFEVTTEYGQYIRPALVTSGEDVICVWTRTEATELATIWIRQRRAGTWMPAERLLPRERGAHQNPEIASGPGDEVAVVYQSHVDGRYGVFLRVFQDGDWGRPVRLSSRDSNDWDPTLVYDSRDRLHVAWSAYVDGDYDIWHVRIDETRSLALEVADEASERISARGLYDLHPWITRGESGRVWLTWDAVQISNHMSSGKTTITGANLTKEEPGSNFRGSAASIEVRVIDDDVVRDPGGGGSNLQASEGYLLSHSALPKVAIGPGGEPWIVYRALRGGENPWDPRQGVGYYWDLLGQSLGNGAWSEAVRLADSDGYLEEAGVVACADGLRIVYGGERRRTSAERVLASPDPPEDANHHRDFDGFAGCNGDVYVASLGSAGELGPDVASLARATRTDDVVRTRHRSGPYEVRHGGETYKLLWGDTHKHSNVSRCSRGIEPSPQDQYRYGMDLGRFDFFALSDHAEHFRLTRLDAGYYYWWLQHKLADLYHIPGHMSALYNLEWTLRFPHGHHNVIFPDRSTVFLARDLATSDTLAKGWDVLEQAGARAITIPHTGASLQMGTTWETYDARFERLCEVFQASTGSYEHEGCPRQFHNSRNDKGFYWEALEKGYRIGVIASSDHGFGQAYACVYALENTRESIWQALWDRRTYGSTTYGLILDVRSGEHWMGEAWSSENAPVLTIQVTGAAPLRSVEILGRSSVLWSAGTVDEPLDELSFAIEWTDPDWDDQGAEQWYYVRVIQVDDEMAWSSPVWVRPE